MLPYRSATQSGIVQTAFSFETPVIVTRVGGLPDVVIEGETGYIVPPDDPSALAAAIRRFFDENAAGRMSAGIRGDADRNGQFNGLADALFSLNAGFVPGAPSWGCRAAADADGNGVVNGLADALYTLSASFVPGSPLPPPPFPDCGLHDVAPLGCESPPNCP